MQRHRLAGLRAVVARQARGDRLLGTGDAADHDVLRPQRLHGLDMERERRGAISGGAAWKSSLRRPKMTGFPAHAA